MPAGIYRQAGLHLHNQIYFELAAFGSQDSEAFLGRQKYNVLTLRQGRPRNFIP